MARSACDCDWVELTRLSPIEYHAVIGGHGTSGPIGLPCSTNENILELLRLVVAGNLVDGKINERKSFDDAIAVKLSILGRVVTESDVACHMPWPLGNPLVEGYGTRDVVFTAILFL